MGTRRGEAWRGVAGKGRSIVGARRGEAGKGWEGAEHCGGEAGITRTDGVFGGCL
ncbi:MAG: hypothetical protein LBB09_02920 [Rickettsiales bacterium]|nr:hypothetical protein [Rickettsiales bacterium]